LNRIIVILNRSVDALMKNLTLDLHSEVTALRDAFDIREN
jgi:hypothetical protein